MHNPAMITEKQNRYEITLTQNARDHFLNLLAEEDMPGTALRMWVDNGGTPQAKVNIIFCGPNEEEAGDELLEFQTLKIFLAKSTGELLRKAHIDFQETEASGKLAIHAPFIRGSASSESSPLRERIEYILEFEINPGLASHKGHVELVDIVEDKVIIVRMSGGCQGCGMAQVTLKQGIERRLKEQFPEITEIRDATEHAAGTNPYY